MLARGRDACHSQEAKKGLAAAAVSSGGLKVVVEERVSRALTARPRWSLKTQRTPREEPLCGVDRRESTLPHP